MTSLFWPEMDQKLQFVFLSCKAAERNELKQQLIQNVLAVKFADCDRNLFLPR